ncbi:MAG: glycosyltransferase [Oscillospiraceae bacterium]|nr:glycosyltransferase [Oscillospiraceae bacterium]
MSRVEVLVATVNQYDFSLIDKMNLQTDAVIANQAGKVDYSEYESNGTIIKMISTNTVGAGINRNMALTYSTGDILMLADDDVSYIDGYGEIIQSAFMEVEKADILIFRVNSIKNGELIEDCPPIQKRLHLHNALKYGTCRIAIKRRSMLQANIHFHDFFGPGCSYYMSEDTLFIIECLKKKLKIYAHNGFIGNTLKDYSTWFCGYDEKFWYNKGAFIAAGLPRLRYPLMIYFLWRFRKESGTSLINRLKFMHKGIIGYGTLQSYEEYANKVKVM